MLAYGALNVGYMSLGTNLQSGIRYVLPALALACVLAGGGWAYLARWNQRAAWLVASLVTVLGGVELARHWPNWLGYANATSGGTAAAFRHFNNSDSEWGQLGRDGLTLLRSSETAPFEVLRDAAMHAHAVFDVRGLVGDLANHCVGKLEGAVAAVLNDAALHQAIDRVGERHAGERGEVFGAHARARLRRRTALPPGLEPGHGA